MRQIASPFFAIVVLLNVSAVASSHLEQEALTWDNLDARIVAEVKAGFSGVILVVRDGEEVLDKAFGMANREESIPNRTDTIFGTGSTPIDFTHVGIRILAQQGKLSLDDPITKFFDKVPEDKRSITIQHLMTGRGERINFAIERGGKKMTVAVKPKARK